MLNRTLTVLDAAKQEVPGQVEVNEMATRWSFRPDQPWAAGRYQSGGYDARRSCRQQHRPPFRGGRPASDHASDRVGNRPDSGGDRCPILALKAKYAEVIQVLGCRFVGWASPTSRDLNIKACVAECLGVFSSGVFRLRA